jgi:hypothetical protein
MVWFPPTAQGVVVRRAEFEPEETQEARRADRRLWSLRSDLALPPRAETCDFISASKPYGGAAAGLRVARVAGAQGVGLSGAQVLGDIGARYG